jgi:hypothetical protein
MSGDHDMGSRKTMKRVIITGSRYWNDRDAIRRELEILGPDWFVIEGGYKGADTIAHEEATKLGMAVATVKANWDEFGVRAGPIRNRWMLDLEPDLVLAFPTDGSVGTLNMVKIAKERGVLVRDRGTLNG